MRKGLALFAGAALTTMSLMATAETSVKIAYDADPVSLDPHEQLSGGTLQLSHMTFDPLVRWTQEFGFEPRLATKWEQVNDTTLRFSLREGVKFHSGNMMTADDVVWTFKRLKSSPDFKGIFEIFEAMNKVDSHTIDLVAKSPFPLAINNATYIFPMDSKFYMGTDANGADKSEIVKHGNSFASRNISGTGPFVVSSREQGVKVEFDRFAGYWDTNSPGNVDKIILTPIKEDPTRVAALISGDVDFIAPVPPTDLDRLKKTKGVDLITMDGTRIIMFQMNQDRVEAFKDARVRQAVAYAINNAGIAKKVMRGFAVPAGQFSPEGYLGYNKNLKPRYNLAQAKKLMAEAGYADGFSITMMAPNNRYVNDDKIAEAVASMLAKINISVDLKTMPKAQYWPKFDERAADMMMIGWHSDTEDTNNFFEFLAACPNTETGAGQYNSGNYCNTEVDAMIKQANSETVPEKRAAIMQKMEEIVYNEAGFIPLHWQNLAFAARKGVNIKPVINTMNFPYLGDLVVK